MSHLQEVRGFPRLCSDPASAAAGSGVAEPLHPCASLSVRLESAERTLRDISHAFAHDLRTSLRHVASYAQLLGDPAYVGEPEQVGRLSLKVLESSRQLRDLMDSVSDFARLQVEELQWQTVDTQALARSVIEELAEQNGRAVVVEVAPDLPAVQGDPELLRRVWQELLANAWRHAASHAHPCIRITHEPVPGGHAYWVHDNGEGFNPDAVGWMFGLFQRERSVNRSGAGVGLAMVRRIIECHGGRVSATACPGDGATFGFSLPAVAG